MVTLPAVTPVTVPEPSTVAMVLLLLSQVPPLTVLVMAVVLPAHTTAVPERVPAEVGVPTLITKSATAVPHILLTVYIMVSRPEAIPPTTPVLSTRALPLLALQVPPLMASVRGVPALIHTLDEPVMVPASGSGLMVMLLIADAVPQLLVTE